MVHYLVIENMQSKASGLVNLDDKTAERIIFEVHFSEISRLDSLLNIKYGEEEEPSRQNKGTVPTVYGRARASLLPCCPFVGIQTSCWFVTIRISSHAFIHTGKRRGLGFSRYLKRYDEMQLNRFKYLLILRHFLSHP